MTWPKLPQWTRLAVGVAVLTVLIGWCVVWPGARRWQLSFSAGDPLGERHVIAKTLSALARPHGVVLDLVPTVGSRRSLSMIEDGTLDVALVQGGLAAGPTVRQVAAMYREPLHLAVRPALAHGTVPDLDGRRVNLGAHGSGTRVLATRVLEFSGIDPARDLIPLDHTYEELQKLPPEELPDAVFTVQSLPSDLVAWLIRARGYRLAAIPFGQSLSFRDMRIASTEIPAMMYSVSPAEPPTPLPTIGTSLLLVAHDSVPRAAVLRLLEVITGGELARRANLPQLTPRVTDGFAELPLHSGALAFQRRSEPFLKADLIESVENARSFLVSVAVALFLLWRWIERRTSAKFDRYIDEVTRIERSAMHLEESEAVDFDQLLALRRELSTLKAEALERFTFGQLKGEELMTSFLNHVSDTRGYLNALILHERDHAQIPGRTER